MKVVNIYQQNCKKVTHRKARVTAIIPNYNYDRFLNERIDSILLQTYPVDELIILDDASTDESVKTIEKKIDEAARKFPGIKIVFIRNKENSGGKVFSQWRKGLKRATGDYIWIAEADDSADRTFLENAVSRLNHNKKANVFYSDSCRIDQDNNIIKDSCQDLVDMWHCGRWRNDYDNSGKDEIEKYLSANNTIINVSSVVWRNSKDLDSIFKEAENYKIAGDWYIYVRVLEFGDIAYCAKPLNYYRKHGSSSVTSSTSLDKELQEVSKIQSMVEKKYSLTEGELVWQRKRVRLMGGEDNTNQKQCRGKIAWFGVDFNEGSGGHRTIFQNINYLSSIGFQCDYYLSDAQDSGEALKEKIERSYFKINARVFSGIELRDKYDMAIATYYDTAKIVSKLNVSYKVYFAQDYEPWFFPASEQYMNAEDSYKLGLSPITIGKWLTHKLDEKFPKSPKSRFFNFCADLDVYRPCLDVDKEMAICAVLQPAKPRRCTLMELKALQIVKIMKPEVKIYLYGSEKCMIENLDAIHLGVLSVSECNELYNRCMVGVCMSASNTSRIPFEMMAAGLPVVELYRENNLYDLPDGGVLLAEPNAEAIASAIIEILDNAKKREDMSKYGEEFMRGYPIELGYWQFAKCVEGIMNNEKYGTMVGPIVNKCKAFGATADNDWTDELGEIKLVSMEDVEATKKEREWRDNLTIPQRIYLKIRYILLGR